MSSLLPKFKIFFAAVMVLSLFLFLVFSIAADSSVSMPLPALQPSGTLGDTPQTVSLCAPLNIQYSITNPGAAPLAGGQLTIEIKTADNGQVVFSQPLPLTMKRRSLMLENVDFPPGAYTITLKASLWNRGHQIARDYTLAGQALTVSAPILVKKSNSAIPRVLLWLNQNGTAIQQAFAEMIVNQAFEEEGVYYATADTQEDFTDKAMSGEFNTFVLFETDELLERSDWLRDRLLHGQGLVIIGSEDRTRMIAETFGFKFREAPPTAGAVLLLTEESGMGLSGTIPVSGRILQPIKKNAKPAALFADKRPAILVDTAAKGRVIVMPFSLTHSALDTGSTSLYSLLLRMAVLKAAPENETQTGISSTELLVSAPSGPVKAHVEETLPPGTRIIWTNNEGTVNDNAILYDLIVDKEPQSLLYLCQPPAGNKTPAFTEVFYECNEKLVSQGKIE